MLMIDKDDLIITTFSSKRKGGWSMAEDEGIKIYHKPSGKEFACEKFRSQHKNKSECLRLLQLYLRVDAVMKKAEIASEKAKDFDYDNGWIS